MAPVTRLALECLHAAEDKDLRLLSARLREFLAVMESGSPAIAQWFKRALPARRESVLLTHSYSATVVRAITTARSRIDRVLCSEGRPNYEGHRMARELTSAGVKTELLTDSAITEFVGLAAAVVLGADAVTDQGMRNKVGTSALVACALQKEVPVWVLADSSKFLPRSICDSPKKLPASDGSPEEVWPRHPARIRVRNPYFAWTKFHRGIRILTETGWTTPRDIRRHLARLRLTESRGRRFD